MHSIFPSARTNMFSMLAIAVINSYLGHNALCLLCEWGGRQAETQLEILTYDRAASLISATGAQHYHPSPVVS